MKTAFESVWGFSLCFFVAWGCAVVEAAYANLQRLWAEESVCFLYYASNSNRTVRKR